MAAVNFQPLFCWWCWFFYMRILITRRPCCSTWDGLLLSKWSKYLLHWKLELVCDWYFRCVRRNIGLRDWWIISAVRRETLTSWWVDYLYEEKLLFYFWMESWRQLQSLRIFLFKLFFSPVIYICLCIYVQSFCNTFGSKSTFPWPRLLACSSSTLLSTLLRTWTSGSIYSLSSQNWGWMTIWR